MIITPTSLTAFFQGLSTQFSTLYRSTPVFWPNVATLYPMSTELETIGWMGSVQTFRQWTGPRQAHGIATEGYQVGWLPWELTIKIDKFKLSDDTYGLYSPLTRNMAIRAAKWPDYLMVSAMQNGGSSTLGLCPDQLSFWNTAHPIDVYNAAAGTYRNDYRSTVLNANNYNTVRSEMMARVDQFGKPIGIMPDLLVVPPALEREAKTIVMTSYYGIQTIGNETMVGTTENVQKGTARVLVLPELAGGTTADGYTNDSTWYLIDSTKPLMPFLFMLREAPTFQYRISPQDPVVFDQHQFLFGGEARGNYAYALPFLASRGVAAA